MNLRNPPQDFAPAWIARMRERKRRAFEYRMATMESEARLQHLRWMMEHPRTYEPIAFA